MGSIFCAQASMFENIAYHLGFGEKARRYRETEEFVREEFKKGTSVPELELKLSEKANNTPEGKLVADLVYQRKIAWENLENCRSEGTTSLRQQKELCHDDRLIRNYYHLCSNCRCTVNGYCSEFVKEFNELVQKLEIACSFNNTPEEKMAERFRESLANRRCIQDKERELQNWEKDPRESKENIRKKIKRLEAEQNKVEKELKEQFLGKN